MTFLHHRRKHVIPATQQTTVPPVLKLHRFHKNSTVLQSIEEFVQGTKKQRSMHHHILRMLRKVQKKEKRKEMHRIRSKESAIRADIATNAAAAFIAVVVGAAAIASVYRMRRTGS